MLSTDHDDAIIVENLTKHFRIPHERKITMYDHFIGLFRGGRYNYEDLLALDNISFRVMSGETFGIIGANGSGKSTLLKILAGIIYPDGGVVHVRGKIAPFIELGVGFQPDLSAKDNIFLYGAIMGLRKKTIQERYHDILSFAELERFENMRLKNFSSGMVVRLAFSTAIQTNPSILLVDEVLSVGDESFQRKCNDKINELKENGKTIIFVSHSLETVYHLCTRCLLLHKGRVIQIGETPHVLHRYLQITQDHDSE